MGNLLIWVRIVVILIALAAILNPTLGYRSERVFDFRRRAMIYRFESPDRYWVHYWLYLIGGIVLLLMAVGILPNGI